MNLARMKAMTAVIGDITEKNKSGKKNPLTATKHILYNVAMNFPRHSPKRETRRKGRIV